MFCLCIEFRNCNNITLFIYLFIYLFIILFADIDECTASFPVCDVNANCMNTLGSYLCSCKTGFSGDGKTCQGEKDVQLYAITMPCTFDTNYNYLPSCVEYQHFQQIKTSFTLLLWHNWVFLEFSKSGLLSCQATCTGANFLCQFFLRRKLWYCNKWTNFLCQCPCLSAGQRNSKLPRKEGRKISKRKWKMLCKNIWLVF